MRVSLCSLSVLLLWTHKLFLVALLNSTVPPHIGGEGSRSRRGGGGVEWCGDACVALGGGATQLGGEVPGRVGTLASPWVVELLSPRFVVESNSTIKYCIQRFVCYNWRQSLAVDTGKPGLEIPLENTKHATNRRNGLSAG